METRRNYVDLEKGWEFLEMGITKLKASFEGDPTDSQLFNSNDYMTFYSTVYRLCTQKPPHDYSQQLYDRYRKTFDEYLEATVFPSIQEKHDEHMLRELVKRWNNHKVMVGWLSLFFHYLNRYYTTRKGLATLSDVGLICFRDLIYENIKVRAKDVVISFITKEREGEQIDRALLKNALDIFVEVGMGTMDCYKNDFEVALLDDTSAYYSRKAEEYSCPDYISKVEESLKQEEDRVSHYLHCSSEQKLLERVKSATHVETKTS
ncbi:hypothetical protein IFM89_035887 [Coptis chinensis]|uniref:Cullin N-terminal domain-containing protein n=1 Tax=Coptis chinensis TaxID=261450 RepID=A0A835H1F9_9MAGN|nr:hypothetical protein IFM89_035887 [Coptis chinensis]